MSDRIGAVAVKTWKELVRDKKNLALTLGLPVAFMLIFGFAFGEDAPEAFEVAAYDADQGDFGSGYVAGLANLTFDDGRPLLELTRAASEAEARALLTSGDVDAVVLVPPGFSEGLTPTARPGSPGPVPVGAQPVERVPPEGTNVTVLMDPSSQSSASATQIVDAYTQAFAARASGQAPLVVMERETITGAALGPFDYIAPGLMVFAILNMAPQAAAVLARESEKRTLERLKVTRVRAIELLGGVLVAQLGVAAISLALMFGTAILMGFDPVGSLAVAMLVALVTALAVIGAGMIIAAFSKKMDDAANLGILFSVPASFLSGAFFPIPPVELFAWGERTILLYDVLPPTHAVRALRSVLTFGEDLGAVMWEMGALVVLSVAFLAIGAVLYNARRMRTVG